MGARIGRVLQETWLGRWSSWLYGRSLLYIYLLEKSQFYRVDKEMKTVLDVRRFETQLKDFVQVLRKDGVTPAFVLQVLEPVQVPSIQEFRTNLHGMELDDYGRMEKLILGMMEENRRLNYDPWTHLRLYQTYIFSEVVRRTAQELHIQCIDPYPVFAAYRGKDRLFCDVVHLTDDGNRLLAETVAEQVSLPTVRSN